MTSYSTFLKEPTDPNDSSTVLYGKALVLLLNTVYLTDHIFSFQDRIEGEQTFSVIRNSSPVQIQVGEIVVGDIIQVSPSVVFPGRAGLDSGRGRIR